MTAPYLPGAEATAYGNPFIVQPDSVSNPELRTGGGADGWIDHVVGFVLQRVNPRPVGTLSGLPVTPGSREFDMAELVGWACGAAGVQPPPPQRTDLLRAWCYRARSMLRNVDVGLAVKGALLFGPSGLGLSLGRRGRVIVFDPDLGVVIDEHRVSTWTEAGLIPGARGYR